MAEVNSTYEIAEAFRKADEAKVPAAQGGLEEGIAQDRVVLRTAPVINVAALRAMKAPYTRRQYHMRR